ncbi:hypothetical protein Nepgr_001403 [Nepenthes gracilis]|uniref:Uncharacterized protein n=1 Tax=Nepenthes gracilis TaxID=150966 RepID=A0AAD3P4C6_NEPGR|nr:hypothetical protein Nepgr_001403 [Nepenthes gracilis]
MGRTPGSVEEDGKGEEESGWKQGREDGWSQGKAAAWRHECASQRVITTRGTAGGITTAPWFAGPKASPAAAAVDSATVAFARGAVKRFLSCRLN